MGKKPQYSILYCNQDLSTNYEDIKKWLKEGIKVFWFGKREEVQKLKEDFYPFVSALFLQCYEITIKEKALVIDGKNCKTIVNILEKKRPEFNAAQYLVEHCKADMHIIVEASAGTGKTTVMIDRILYLLHTIEDLKPTDIYMITFTNEATNQMNEKLQKVLLTKYKLTGNTRYLKWMEEQSQMHISTIHSFAYMLLKTYGIEAGFSKGIQLHTLNYERKELIKDELNNLISEQSTVQSQIGISFYRGNATLDKYWKKFAQLGFSKKEIMEMNWGQGIDEPSEKFQKAALKVFDKLDDDYIELKRKNNTIALNDILRDLCEILKTVDSTLADLSIKYLFVDEFQDSDNSQIKVLCWLIKNLGVKLFVVGDIKQSIYRFRGANDTAFSTLTDRLKNIGVKEYITFTLINNYRTAANVLGVLDQYFKEWAHDGIIDYKKSVKPLNNEIGEIKMYSSAGDYDLEEQFCKITNKALEDRNHRLIKKDVEPTEKDRVVVLCRTNRQLNELGHICYKNHITAVVKREGGFYISEAVRDFYAMISSFIFPDEPKYLFNYLISPYVDLEESFEMRDLEEANGDRLKLKTKLTNVLNKTNWSKYYKEFRLRPVMAVIKMIIETEPVIDNYISKLKRRQDILGWSEKNSIDNALVKAKQYKADLDKLMEILQRNGEGEFSTLYDIYNFLRISIETNRDEQEAEVEDKSDNKFLHCMTVHKAKGMEFDTVIIPFTESRFYFDTSSEVLVSDDNKSVGWKYLDDKTGAVLGNTNYKDIRMEEEKRATQEETRILYVAMTRTIHTLICLVAPDKRSNTWAHLIRKVCGDFEE